MSRVALLANTPGIDNARSRSGHRRRQDARLTSVRREWERAIQQGDLATMTRLIEAGEDINAKDRHGQTALMVAARDGRIEAVRTLLRHGAELDHTAKYHLTALMLAVINGRTEIVRALVDAGADRSARGSGAPGFHEKTALDLARGRERPDLVAAIQTASGDHSDD